VDVAAAITVRDYPAPVQADDDPARSAHDAGECPRAGRLSYPQTVTVTVCG
jgi:hypothetical protein